MDTNNLRVCVPPPVPEILNHPNHTEDQLFSLSLFLLTKCIVKYTYCMCTCIYVYV